MNLSNVRLSWIESIAATEQHSAHSKTVIDFEEIPLHFQMDSVSAESQLHLYHSLKQGDSQLVMAALEQFRGAASIQNHGGIHYKYTYFKITDLAVRVVEEIELLKSELFDRNLFYDKIERVMNANSLYECVQSVQQLMEFLSIHIAGLLQDRENSLVSKVLDYVQEKFRDQGMGLEMLSDQFGNSNYYWSRFFKEKANVHFSEYLWKLRVEEAKRLLRETDYTIKQIVSMIGYLDHASFMRKFKQEESVTPGQYRKLHANNADSSKTIEES